jgi:hypothetical protein
MNGPKVGIAALVKLGQMLETPRMSRYCRRNRCTVTMCGLRTISRKD